MAGKFLKSPECGDADVVVHRFHAWLAHRRLGYLDLNVKIVRRFLTGPYRMEYGRQEGYDYRAKLLIYLEWLHVRHRINFDPDLLRTAGKRQLPEILTEYLQFFATTHRPSTCANCRNALRDFHSWLAVANLTVRGFKRPHAEKWIKSLHTRGLHPSSRIHALLYARSYLRWLKEHGRISCHPDDLVRRSDMPKLPNYLPRPFPPDADAEIIRRLLERDDVYARGFLIMRRTGIRIGELISLPYNCIQYDETGRCFLKVPLGKMYNERLVPLDSETSRLIDTVRGAGPIPRQSLLSQQTGAITQKYQYGKALAEITAGIQLTERVNSHRFRHTYATSLLNGGMSLPGVMKLLGHKDYRMTLRYAAVTNETVSREYFEALTAIEKRYGTLASSSNLASQRAATTLSDVIKSLKRDIEKRSPSGQKKIALLLKRLDRITDEIAAAD